MTKFASFVRFKIKIFEKIFKILIKNLIELIVLVGLKKELCRTFKSYHFVISLKVLPFRLSDAAA